MTSWGIPRGQSVLYIVGESLLGWGPTPPERGVIESTNLVGIIEGSLLVGFSLLFS